MGEEGRGANEPGASLPGVIVWMILLGGYSTINGIMAIPLWSAYSIWTQLYYAISIAAGTCLATLGLVRVASRAKVGLVAMAEMGALALLTANQLAGLWWNTIPCRTPG